MLRDVDSATIEASALAPSASGRASPEQHPLILLIEDDNAIRESVGELLESEGFAFVSAGNGRDALELLKRGVRPALILLDLTMPVMDGWDFRQAQLQDETFRSIPTMVLTAAGFSRETIRLQFGAVDFVRKPVAPSELLAVLNRTCYRGPFASAI